MARSKKKHFPGPQKHTPNFCGEIFPKKQDSCCEGLLFGVPKITLKSSRSADHGYFGRWFGSSGHCNLWLCCGVLLISQQAVSRQGGDVDEKWGAGAKLFGFNRLKRIHQTKMHSSTISDNSLDLDFNQTLIRT